MSRSCTICNGLQEHRFEIDSRIRRGEVLAVIAREFQLSQDALSRHAKNHVLRPTKPVAGDLASRLESLVSRLEEVYDSAAARGDHKMVLDSLKQIGALTAQLVELQKKDAGSFEQMTIPEKLAYIRADGPLYQSWLDFCVRELDGWKREADERERLQRVRELECRSKYLITERQVTDNHLLPH